MTDPVPLVKVEVSFTTNPDDDPVWVDLDVGRSERVIEGVSTSRGRSYEQDTVQTGTAGATLNNASGDFTPGRASGLYYPNVTTDKRMRVSVTPPDATAGVGAYTGGFVGGFTNGFGAGLAYPVFHGYADAWPVALDTAGFYNGTVGLSGLDAFQALGLTELRSDYDQCVLANGPVAYYPMSEPVGDTIGNLVQGSSGNGVLRSRGYGGTYYVRGGDQADFLRYTVQGVDVQDTVVTTTSTIQSTQLLPADSSQSLGLAAAAAWVDNGGGSSNYQFTGGYQADIPNIPAITAAGFAVEMFAVTHPNLLGTAVIAQGIGGDGQSQWILAVNQNPTADTTIQSQLVFAVGPVSSSGAGTSITYNYDVATGHPQHLVGVISDDGTTYSLYGDGQLLVSDSTPAGMSWVGNGKIRVGNGYGLFGTYWYTGQVAKLAIYDRALTNAEIVDRQAARNGHSGELSGPRLNRILDYAGFPAGKRNIDPGQSVTGPLISADTDALSLIQSVVSTEQGVAFMDTDGDFRFRDRAATRNTISRVTLGTTALPVEADLSFDYDNARVKNVINASRPNGPTIRITNAPSVAAHRARVYTVTYEVGTDAELAQAAAWETFLYGNPQIRAGTVSLDPLTSPALWPWALTLEIGDRITITGLPSYAPASSFDFIIQQVSHEGSPGPQATWKTTFQLSPVVAPTLRADGNPSALTKLDSGLKIAY